MKKSIVAMGVGIFTLVTILLCVNTENPMYQKKKHFDTVNDVLMQLETNKIKADNRNSEKETDEFQECLSKRKRLTYSEFNFERIKIEKIEELEDEKKKYLIGEYNKIQEKLSMPYKTTKIQPVRLDVKGTYPYKDAYGNPVQRDSVIDLVMVDEGEGMVIDYYVQHDIENKDNEEENIHAKG